MSFFVLWFFGRMLMFVCSVLVGLVSFVVVLCMCNFL